jgi:hypothetical protein
VSLELEPIGRYEWERLVRRARLPKPVKLLALVLATYADPDGSRVRPGLPVLASVTGDSERNVGRLLRHLVDDLGLLRQVARGGGRGGKGRASVYRLTIPVDLLDRLEMLSPEDSPPDSPDIQMSSQSDESPVDNHVDNSVSADTWMSSQSGNENDFHRTSGATFRRLTGHSDPIDRTSGCPPTTHIHQPLQDQPVIETRTQLTTARERRTIFTVIEGGREEPPDDLVG